MSITQYPQWYMYMYTVKVFKIAGILYRALVKETVFTVLKIANL